MGHVALMRGPPVTFIFPRALLAACAFAAAALLSVAAGAASHGDCGAEDPQRSIAGCTVLIDEPRTAAGARVRALVERGIAREKAGDPDGALGDYSAALAVSPREVYLLQLRGLLNGDLHRDAEAIADFSAALEIDPQNVDSLQARALVYNNTHDYDRAIADLSLAVTLKPEDPTLFAARALAFAQRGDIAHALEDYDAAIKLDPGHASYYLGRAHLRARTGDHDGTIADATAAIELAPDDVIAHLDRARAYVARAHGSVTEDLRKALADCDIVVRREPGDAVLRQWALNERGRLHHALGEFDAAIADFTLLLGLDPTAAKANVARARSYAAKGDFKRAVADYDVALKTWPADAKLLALRAEAAAKLAATP
jgi:tetratricopeptide (TPR) repeat protein